MAARNRQSRFFVVAWTLGSVWCLLLVGCGTEHKLVPVTGRVVVDGKGLTEAEVTFEPVADGSDPLHPPPTSFGLTDKDGNFSLKTVRTGEEGAVPGEHVVHIRPKVAEYDPAKALRGEDRVLLPEDWRNGSLRFPVPDGGTHRANFESP